MPFRTTQPLVRGIIKIKSTIDLDPYIEPANELVTELCASATKGDPPVSFHTDVRLELIERWLAAHYVAVAYRRAIQESVGSVQVTYEGKVALLLHVTEYGQKAILLDTSGRLAAYNNTLLTVKTQLPIGANAEGKKRVHFLGNQYGIGRSGRGGD